MCPLLIATENDDLALIGLCIKHPAVDLNIKNRDGKTALNLAAEGNDFEIVKILLDIDDLKIERHDVKIAIACYHLCYYLPMNIDSCSCG